VAGLALLAASTGLCVGCETYRLLARLRGIGPRSVARIDLQEIGASPQAGLVVQFTHPVALTAAHWKNACRPKVCPRRWWT